MCKSLADGGTRCAAHTRPAYTAIMGDASLLPPAELRKRLDAHTDDRVNYATTKPGSAQIAQDIYHLERTYELALGRAPYRHRRRLERDQQAVLAALNTAHTQAMTRRDAQQRAVNLRDTATYGHKSKKAAVEYLADGAEARASAIGQPLPWRIAFNYKRHLKSLTVTNP